MGSPAFFIVGKQVSDRRAAGTPRPGFFEGGGEEPEEEAPATAPTAEAEPAAEATPAEAPPAAEAAPAGAGTPPAAQ